MLAQAEAGIVVRGLVAEAELVIEASQVITLGVESGSGIALVGLTTERPSVAYAFVGLSTVSALVLARHFKTRQVSGGLSAVGRSNS